MLGAVERVRPKMMTVVAIMAGLIPILWSTGHRVGSDAADCRADDRRHGLIDLADPHRHPGHLCPGQGMALAEGRRGDERQCARSWNLPGSASPPNDERRERRAAGWR